MTSILPRRDGTGHWLLAGSLGLNFLLVGAAGAVALRYTSAVPLSNVSHIAHGAADQLDRLAETLPPPDAQIIRTQLRADAKKVASAQADLRLSRDEYRESLRADPFNLGAMHTAMIQVQSARTNYDLVLHDVIAAAAVKMSVVGRNKLADWPNGQARRLVRN